MLDVIKLGFVHAMVTVAALGCVSTFLDEGFVKRQGVGGADRVGFSGNLTQAVLVMGGATYLVWASWMVGSVALDAMLATAKWLF